MCIRDRLFMVPGDTDDIKKEYEVLLGELHTDISYELLLKCHTGIRDFCIFADLFNFSSIT